MSYRAYVITSSDSCFAGTREDASGPVAGDMLKEAGFELAGYALLPDERMLLADRMREICDRGEADLIVTTGGTGFSQRDVTPEAALDVIERQTPGLPELMRAESMKATPYGCLSRGTAGIRKRSLILNLPGSEKAARENLQAVLYPVRHGLKMLFADGSSDHGGAHHG